jgi:DNA-binding MarR family transcriptional regulator
VKPTLPPSYVNTPVAIAYADVDDALIVTMTRILGLCWAYDYERSPALTPEQLAEFTGRPRSTLYRHLKQLREMQWIRIDQAGRRIIIRPIVARNRDPAEKETCTADATSEPAYDEALLQALAEIGVENPKRDELARLDLDPLWVRAWHLWARHLHRRNLTNPVGCIILKLEGGERPADEFLRAAQEQIQLRRWMQEQEEREEEDLEEDNCLEPQPDTVSDEARQIWARCLEELELQMTRATFDTWLRGSHVVEAGDDSLTIGVRHAYAVDWLQYRLLPAILPTVARHAGGDVKITFVAGT